MSPLRLLARPLVATIAAGSLLLVLLLPAGQQHASAANGTWSGTYYNNLTLSGSPVLSRDDGATLDYTWAGSPGAGVNADAWSARWSKTDTYAAGTYRFTVTVDDGVRVFVDGVKILDAWVDQAATTYTVDHAVAAGSHTVMVEYYENCCEARISVGIAQTGAPPPTNWTGQYFNNKTLSGSPALTRDDGSALDFTWGTGSPGPGVNADNFSVRWEKTSTYTAGTHRFSAITNDGMRIYVDSVLVLDKWFDQPATAYTVDYPLTAGSHTVRVDFYEGINTARAKLDIQNIGGTTGSWSAQYFANKTLSGTPALTRQDAAINFNWGQGSPGAGVPTNNFSARWTQTVDFQAGVHEFTVTSDDGARVFLDGALILNYWVDQSATTHSVNRTVTAGQHTIVVEYYEGGGNATMQFSFALNPLIGGFYEESVVTGLDLPTAFAFVPDGRIFFAEKSGVVRVYKNGLLLPTPFYTVTPVNDHHDRGLLGIAVDPNFASNGYVYLSYTYDNNPSDPDGEKTAQVIRVTANGDVAQSGSKVVLLGSVTGNSADPSCEDWPLTADCIPSDYDSHSIGNIKFGADGMLYVATGDGASYNTVDVRALRAQSIDRLAGKILRVNPANGQGLTDNPFYNGNLNSTRSKVWAYGVRNAFRFGFKPGTNTIFSGDVGWSLREEVNVATSGRNLGWPCYEGTLQQSGYAAYSQCQALYSAGGVTFGVHTYDHNPEDAAVVAGGFTGTNNYPPEFQNAYWFGDYSRDEIRAFKVDASNNMVPGSMKLYTNGAHGPVQIEVGADGDVYYLSINGGELRRVRHVGGNRPPVAVAGATPSNGLTPLAVNFSSAGSNDPDAGQTVTYDWDFGDGSAHSAAANPSHTYTTAGTYTARLTVADPFGLTATDTEVIQAGNSAPTATITAPDNDAKYDVGDVITFGGTGSDTQDGALPGASLAWSVVMKHCADGTYTPSTCHPHTHHSQTGASGQFTIADHGDFVFYEVFLTATDSGGLTDTEKVTITANTVDLTFDANRAGIRVTVDATDQVVPFTRTVPRKSAHTIFAASPQTVAGGTYDFSAWSDGGAQQHVITANAAGTYTANFADPPTPTPTATPTVTATGTVPPTATTTPTQTPTPVPGAALAQDTFQRPNQSLWGTASDGQVWGGEANTLSWFSIVSNAGQVSGGNAPRDAVLGPTVANVDVLFTGSLSTWSGGGNIGSVVRWQNTNTWYKAYITGTTLVLQKRVNGTYTILSTVPFTATAGTQYSIRFQAVGTTLRVRVWAASAAEPGTWNITATDGSIASGRPGIRVHMLGSAVARITSFRATSPP
jgi:glucose/arabinose dehydrogenase